MSRHSWLEAIANDPDDDGIRLSYADWLQEHGRLDRAEFIRVQIEIARLRDEGGDGNRLIELERRERALLCAHYDRWSDGGNDRKVVFIRGLSEGIDFGDRKIDLSNVDSQCSRLSYLKSSNCTTARLERLLLNSPYIHCLQTLDLSGCGLGDDGVAVLATSPTVAGLQTLVLSDNGIGDVGVVDLAKSSHLAGLRSLDLSKNAIGEAGIAALATSPHLTGLRTLGLSHALTTPPAEEPPFLSAEERPFSARIASTSNATIGDKVAEILSRSPNVATLRALDLSGNGIGDAGAEELANSPQLAELQELILRENQITNAGAEALANSPHLATLQALNLSRNRTRGIGADALKNYTREQSFRRAIADDSDDDNTPLVYADWLDGFSGVLSIRSPERRRARLASLVLAVDIEMDGDGRIAEVGVADGVGQHCLLATSIDISNNSERIKTRLEELARSRPLIVGHNVWHHDIPQLRDQISCDLTQFGPVWDTQWVSALMTPDRETHALLDSERPHEARYDAKATIDLWRRQFEGLAPEFMEKLRDAWQEGYRGVDVIIESVSRALPPLSPTPAKTKTLILPNKLRSRLWQKPNTLDPLYASRLPDHGGEIIEHIPSPGPDADPVPSPAIRVLAVLLGRARASGLRTYRQMLPDIVLLDKSVRTQLQESSAPDVDASIGLCTPSSLVEALARDGRDLTSLPEEMDRSLWLASITKLGAIEIEAEDDAFTIRGFSPTTDHRFHAHERLEYCVVNRPWNRVYGKKPTEVVARLKALKSSASEVAELCVLDVPEWERAGFWDDADVLWPTTGDRFAYWRQTIRKLLSLASARRGTLLIVAVDDERELEIVETLCSERGVGLTVGDPERSRLRRIEQAIDTGLSCIFVPAGDLPEWLSSGRSLGERAHGKLVPVLLRVPFEMWTAWPEDESAISDRHEQVRKALESYLVPWVHDVVTWDDGEQPAICLDDRVPLALGRSTRLTRRSRPSLVDLDTRATDVLATYRQRFGDRPSEPPPTDVESYRSFLQTHWAYPDFRPSQQGGLRAIVEGTGDVLVTLPTGEGKSVLFQVPALLRGRVTGRLSIVVTPLRALMQDQVRSLRERGFATSVDFITADRDAYTLHDVYQRVLDGTIRLLYVAPERFQSTRFRRTLLERSARDGGLEFIVFDEAHCLSEWGFQFRPDYVRSIRYVNEFLRSSRDEVTNRVLLFSATVTALVQRQLREIVSVEERAFTAVPEVPQWPLQPFIDVEPRLAPDVFGPERDSTQRATVVLDLLDDPALENEESSSIVFVARRRDAEQVARSIDAPPSRSEFYHARLSRPRRVQAFEQFRDRETRRLAATCAFGMGMDVPHIHRCVHFTPPKTVESLVQEIGRIGRDAASRKRAGLDRLTAYALHAPTDFEWLNARIEQSRLTGDDLVRVWAGVRSHTRAIGDARLSFVPDDWTVSEGTQAIGRDKVQLALFWLEECGRCFLEAVLPSMLELRLHRERLHSVAERSSNVGRIARVLLGVVGAKSSVVQVENAASKGWLDRIVGFFTGPPIADEESQSPDQTWAGQCNLVRVMEDAGLDSLDRVVEGCRELEREGAIEILRDLVLEPARRFESSADLLKSVRAHCDRLLNRVTWREEAIHERKPQPEDGDSDTFEDALKRWKRRRRESIAAMNLLLGLGLFEELPGTDGHVEYRRRPRFGRAAGRVVSSVFTFAHGMHEVVSEAGGLQCTASLAEILEKAGKRIRQRRVQLGFRLLDDLEVLTCQQSLLPMTYVIRVTSTTPLVLPHEKADARNEEDTRLVQLFQLQDLAELRVAAVETVLNIEDDDIRRIVVEQYFQSESLEDLKRAILDGLASVSPDRELVCSAAQEGQQVLRARREESMHELVEDVRPKAKQEAVVVSHQANLLVNAGPGSGKTHLLLARAAYHVHASLRPEQIMLLAFNRAVVGEIRERVRRRFEDLGYGQYGRRIQCFTFHGLAERYLRRLPADHPELMSESTLDQDDDPSARFDSRLETFTRICEGDGTLADRVMGGVRMLLVDEFQDVNYVMYRLLLALTRNRSIGVTVVGDDDQDIVGFTREGDDEKEGRAYFERFRADHEDVVTRTLDLNMRSVPEIVEAANNFAERLLLQAREKAGTTLASEREASTNAVTRESSPVGVEYVRRQVERLSDELCSACNHRAPSIAILCRTNLEAVRWYEEIRDCGGASDVQPIVGAVRLRLVQERMWGELLNIVTEVGTQLARRVIDSEAESRIRAGFQSLPIPECNEDVVSELLGIARAERGQVTFDSLGEALQQFSTTDLVWRRLRRGDRKDGSARVVVTVVHRVKGLEFDGVIVLPSSAKFPLTGGGDLRTEAREEARVYYVAMTRARDRLVACWGPREGAWHNATKRDESTSGGGWIDGSPRSLFLNFPGEPAQRRQYIREKVCIGDPVELEERNGRFHILHGPHRTRIGITSSQVSVDGGPHESASCRVAAVWRFEPRGEWLDRLREKDAGYPGWHYVPLIQGSL